MQFKTQLAVTETGGYKIMAMATVIRESPSYKVSSL